MKKHDYATIKAAFESEGCVLLSTAYTNNAAKLDFICPNGHTYSITWGKWVVGCRCAICAGNVKFTTDFVRSELLKEGYILISTEYINTNTKLKSICPNGHEHEAPFSSWRNGYRCGKCAGNVKHDVEFIREQFKQEGYVLLSDAYVNNESPLRIICNNGHTGVITWGKWVVGCRCAECANNKKLTLEFIKSEFSKENYKILSTEYNGAHVKLDYECPVGHKHAITWAGWSTGHRCVYCSGLAKPEYDKVKQSLAQEGYTLLSEEYVNAHSKLACVCVAGHQINVTWSGWVQNRRCDLCDDLKKSGPGNSNWNLGSSFGEYCQAWQDKEYKFSIRERDGHKCLNPYCSSKNPGRLNIHHVNYDKKDCHFKNLITVCHECNIKANTNREWHQSWYQALLHNRYGYNY